MNPPSEREKKIPQPSRRAASLGTGSLAKGAKRKHVEVLAPAGDYKTMQYAIAFGADAVYAGLPAYSLRTRENTFDMPKLKEAIQYCHDRGKKIYITINIFPRNSKIPHFLKAIKEIAAMQPDAFIMADPGLIMLAKEHAPEIPIHLSVQSNNVNYASAQFWHQQQGIERIILSRELSKPEIQEIIEKNPGLEVELFVHGAICISYSGRCLLSQYMSFRDPNQGSCSHSCRWKYYVLEEDERKGNYMPIEEDDHGTYIMNSKDMCLLEYIPDLVEMGIDSLKIEGRSKTLYYASIITRAYKEAVEAAQAGKLNEELQEELIGEAMSINNRGYIAGFFVKDPQKNAQEYEKRNGAAKHFYAGIIEKREGNTLTILCKNRLDKGDAVQLCFPDRKHDFWITLDMITDLKGEKHENFSGGQGSFTLNLSDEEMKQFELGVGGCTEDFLPCVMRKEEG